jgi:hypothetical protein
MVNCIRATLRGENRVSSTPAHPEVARAPGGDTLGRVWGELDADFTALGSTASTYYSTAHLFHAAFQLLLIQDSKIY